MEEMGHGCASTALVQKRKLKPGAQSEVPATLPLSLYFDVRSPVIRHLSAEEGKPKRPATVILR